MRSCLLLVILSLAFCNDPEKDMQAVYSQKDYKRFFSVGPFARPFIPQNEVQLKYKVNIGLLGFYKDFSLKEIRNLLMTHMANIPIKIRNGLDYSDSRVNYALDYNVAAFPESDE